MIKNTNELFDIPNVSVLLHMMEVFNEAVYDHCLSVAKHTIDLLDECPEFDEKTKDEIIIGAALHDIGKILVPLNLTFSTKKFTANEFSIMKTHTMIGYEMLKRDFSQIVCDICLYHHEQPGGEGYVSNLTLSQIPEEVLVVQVTDVFDALTSKRNYKANYDPSIALSIMSNDSDNMKIDDGYLEKLKRMISKKGGAK